MCVIYLGYKSLARPNAAMKYEINWKIVESVVRSLQICWKKGKNERSYDATIYNNFPSVIIPLVIISFTVHIRKSIYIYIYVLYIFELNLRVMDGRGHFKALLTSFRRRTLYKDISKCQWKFKLKCLGFFLN